MQVERLSRQGLVQPAMIAYKLSKICKHTRRPAQGNHGSCPAARHQGLPAAIITLLDDGIIITRSAPAAPSPGCRLPPASRWLPTSGLCPAAVVTVAPLAEHASHSSCCSPYADASAARAMSTHGCCCVLLSASASCCCHRRRSPVLAAASAAVLRLLLLLVLRPS